MNISHSIHCFENSLKQFTDFKIGISYRQLSQAQLASYSYLHSSHKRDYRMITRVAIASYNTMNSDPIL